MTKALVLCALALSFVCAILCATGQAQEKSAEAPPAQAMPTPPPARKIPGIVVVDPYPHACVDCHINYVEMKLDTRFSTLIKMWNEQVEPDLLVKVQTAAPQGLTLKGKHPNTVNALKNIPAACLVCHAKDSKAAPPFAAMIHKIHLTGGEGNHFLTMFQGECTFCHKLELSTGHWSIPSAPEKEMTVAPAE